MPFTRSNNLVEASAGAASTAAQCSAKSQAEVTEGAELQEMRETVYLRSQLLERDMMLLERDMKLLERASQLLEKDTQLVQSRAQLVVNTWRAILASGGEQFLIRWLDHLAAQNHEVIPLFLRHMFCTSVAANFNT